MSSRGNQKRVSRWVSPTDSPAFPSTSRFSKPNRAGRCLDPGPAGAGAFYCEWFLCQQELALHGAPCPASPSPRGEAAGVLGLDSRLTPSPDWGTLGDGADAASRPVLAPCSLQRKQRKEGSWALRAQAGRTVLAALLSFLLRSTR